MHVSELIMNDLHPLDFYSIILLAPMRLGDHQVVCVRNFGLLLLTDSRGRLEAEGEPGSLRDKQLTALCTCCTLGHSGVM